MATKIMITKHMGIVIANVKKASHGSVDWMDPFQITVSKANGDLDMAALIPIGTGDIFGVAVSEAVGFVKDEKIVKLYEKHIEESRIKASGVIIPTDVDKAKLIKGL